MFEQTESNGRLISLD